MQGSLLRKVLDENPTKPTLEFAPRLDLRSPRESSTVSKFVTVDERPGGLYVHVPFCERKCIYCDFYSLEDLRRMDLFLDSLLKEIALAASLGSAGAQFDTIFFGGGTPSLLSPRQLESIIEALMKTFSVLSTAEITVETNPGTVDREKLRAYRSLGVDRLSIGVQSFHEDELKFLGRTHDAKVAKTCVRRAQEAGFENVSLDLICSLPGQTRERWESNLRQAVALQTKHISTYSLIVEPRTPLFRMVRSGQVTPLPPEQDAELYELTADFLAAHGFEQYEVSNHAKPGYRSRHNSKYWHHEFYLGFGPSAHSFWTGDSKQDVVRWWNVRSLKQYTEQVAKNQRPIDGDETLDEETLLREEILLGLRSDGIDIQSLRRRYHHDLLSVRGEQVREFIREQLMRVDREKLKLTKKGFLVCDAICEALVV